MHSTMLHFAATNLHSQQGRLWPCTHKRCRFPKHIARLTVDAAFQERHRCLGRAPSLPPSTRASSSRDESTNQSTASVYPYNDGDGKGQKATLEHIFPAAAQELQQLPQQGRQQEQQGQPQEQQQGQHAPQSGPAVPDNGRPQAPWQLGWQVSERNVYWNDDLKARLVKRIASSELGLTDDELEVRLRQLGALLPGLEDRLARAPPRLVARLASDPGQVATRLLALKGIFPHADVSTLVSNRLSLLLDDDLAAVQVAAGRLRELMEPAGLAVDRFVADFPDVLEVECFETALEDARRIMPGVDVISLLRSKPTVVLSLLKGKALIPYDQIANPWT